MDALINHRVSHKPIFCSHWCYDRVVCVCVWGGGGGGGVQPISNEEIHHDLFEMRINPKI